MFAQANLDDLQIVRHVVESLVVHGGEVIRTLLAAALNQRENLHLVFVAASARLLLADIAPIGFVHFNRGAAAAEFASRLDVHCFADAVGHEPSSLVSHAQHAL